MGLVETVDDACRRYKVDQLLIENKGSGHTVHQAMYSLFTGRATTSRYTTPRNRQNRAAYPNSG